LKMADLELLKAKEREISGISSGPPGRGLPVGGAH
jgi:hypothetical protein